MMSKSVGITLPLLAVVFAVLVVFCSEKDVALVNAQVASDAGKNFLDKKESFVITIATNATAYNNGCQGLSACTGSACSRVTCHLPVGGEKNLQCLAVDNNENFNVCPASDCHNKLKLDYNQSFVTLPDPGSLNLQPEVAKAICLQKPLDEGCFKHISVPNDYSLVYFGSVTGAFRAFPGREQNKSQCSSFDPRRRPWYQNGISVSKDVKILVDVSVSMGSLVPVQYNQDSRTTYLNLTQNITHALLQTFSPQDFVEVFKFDSTSVTSLTGGPEFVDPSFDYLVPDRPELAPLINQVNSLRASQDVGASNLTNAINKATLSFKAANYSRVIIVLSNGGFAAVDPAYFPTAKLVSTQTKLMIYKLDTYTTDTYLQSTSLEKVVCSVNGSFEVLDSNAVPNPLYAMRSYFTFLALTHLVAAGNKSTWSNLYTSVSQNLNAITVTYPAFGSDGQLLGVAGVDVVLNGLNRTFQTLVLQDFRNRPQGTLQVPSNIPLTCSYQNAAASVYCPTSPTADNNAICQNLDTSTPLRAITCCGGCSATRKKLSTGEIAGIIVGAIIGLILIAVIAVLIREYLRRRRADPVDAPPPFDRAAQGAAGPNDNNLAHRDGNGSVEVQMAEPDGNNAHQNGNSNNIAPHSEDAMPGPLRENR